eukprot:gene22950-biopygen23775
MSPALAWGCPQGYGCGTATKNNIILWRGELWRHRRLWVCRGMRGACSSILLHGAPLGRRWQAASKGGGGRGSVFHFLIIPFSSSTPPAASRAAMRTAARARSGRANDTGGAGSSPAVQRRLHFSRFLARGWRKRRIKQPRVLWNCTLNLWRCPRKMSDNRGEKERGAVGPTKNWGGNKQKCSTPKRNHDKRDEPKRRPTQPCETVLHCIVYCIVHSFLTAPYLCPNPRPYDATHPTWCSFCGNGSKNDAEGAEHGKNGAEGTGKWGTGAEGAGRKWKTIPKIPNTDLDQVAQAQEHLPTTYIFFARGKGKFRTASSTPPQPVARRPAPGETAAGASRTRPSQTIQHTNSGRPPLGARSVWFDRETQDSPTPMSEQSTSIAVAVRAFH